MPIIEVQNLSKNFRIPKDKKYSIKANIADIFRRKDYEILEAVNDLSFSVDKGEFFGIVGKNGSGKSTLLKILANIYKPTEGNVNVNGSIAPFVELGVGFHPDLTGRENTFLNGTILGLSRKEVAEKYSEIVKFAELERFMDQKIRNYSSGMWVRLAFSIAMLVGTDILLLDEVLSVGDKDFQEKCFDKFKEFKEEERTVLLVTHHLGQVRKFCDKVLFLDRGKLAAVGETNEILDKYINF
ncbi:ATP-binding cassette domain-containing protein [Candidatus Peregrinibacteria bacterium]|nr:ATP-binding cassette domain-containing protein [Candidatus Peregrinibacteria bacterium]